MRHTNKTMKLSIAFENSWKLRISDINSVYKQASLIELGDNGQKML